jgi:hypothetical protein
MAKCYHKQSILTGKMEYVKVKCKEIIDQVCTELSEDINSDLCSELSDHLLECQDCQNNVLSLQKTIELYKCVGKAKIPTKVHERLMTILNLPESK